MGECGVLLVCIVQFIQNQVGQLLQRFVRQLSNVQASAQC